MTTSALPPFSAWAGPRNPKLLFVGEAWGEAELAERKPFVGSSGKEFWLMLGEALADYFPEQHRAATKLHPYGNAWIKQREAWLTHTEIAFTNVFNLRPHANKLDSISVPKTELPKGSPALDLPPLTKGRYLEPQFLGELERLEAEIELAQPNLVVCLGNTACWALLRQTNISQLRGSVTAAEVGTEGQLFKILPTYHPQGVVYNWSWRPIVVADLAKAYREAQFPELRRPERQVLVEPTLPQVRQWVSETLASPPALLSCDIETASRQITCVGFARSRSEAIVVPFWDRTKPGWSYWDTDAEELEAWQLCEALLASNIPKLGQNFIYDMQYLLPLGLRLRELREDTMLYHHSLFPEMLKGLGFLGSIYSQEPAWKLMRRKRADTIKADE